MLRTQIARGATYLTYIFLFVMLFMALFFNLPGVFVFSIPLQVATFVLGEVLLVLILLWLKVKHPKLQYFTKLNNKKVVFGLCLLFIVQVLFASQFYAQAGNDPEFITEVAQEFYAPKLDIPYFSKYPNNLLLLFFEHAVYKLSVFGGVATRFYFILVTTNIVAIDTALYLMYVITKKIWTNRIASYTLLLGIMIFAFTPWMSVVYSDILSLPISLLIFYIYLQLKEQRECKGQVLFSFCFGMMLYIGFLIKPQTIFIAIATTLVELFLCQYKRLLRSAKPLLTVGLVSVSVLVGMVTIRVPFDYLVERQQLIVYDASLNFPLTHWMMMGLKPGEHWGNKVYGSWNRADFELTSRIEGKEAKIQKHMEVISDRLQSFGFFGYVQYLFEKAIWIFSDGTFYWANDGIWNPVTSKKGMKQVVQNFIYPSGRYHEHYVYVLQTAWFIVLSALAMVLFGVKKYASKQFFIVTCTIMGTILFTLFFEGRSRYLMSNLGFFIIAGGLGLDLTIERLQILLHKGVKKKNLRTVQ